MCNFKGWAMSLVSAAAAAAVSAQDTHQAPEQLITPVNVISTPLPFRQLEKLEITGSSILRKEQTQSLPVQVITRTDIQKSGKADVAELIQSLPVMSAFSASASIGQNRGGYNGGAIHGMHTGTLVLINGQRLAGYGRQLISGDERSGVELSLLPLSAIERIEILTDGASSIYGSDALAGVINLITRTERQGVEVSAERRLPDLMRGLGYRVDFSAGQGKLKQDGYSWIVSADIQNQAQLLGSDRPYASPGRYLIEQNGQQYWAYGPSLKYNQTSPTLSGSKTAPYTQLWSANYQNGQCPENKVPAYGQPACLDNPYREFGLYPQMQAQRLFTQGQWMLDSNWVVSSSVGAQKSVYIRNYNTWPNFTTQIGNAPSAPGYDLALSNGFDPLKGTWLLYSGSDLGVVHRRYELENRHASLGLKGQLAGWDLSATMAYSDETAQYGSVGMKSSNLGVNAQGVLINPALLQPLNGSSESAMALQQQLMNSIFWYDVDKGKTSVQRFEVHGSRSIAELAGQDVLLAVGVDVRKEINDYVTYAPTLTQPAYQGQRRIFAQYAELQVPLFANFEALASLRNDHYSDFGNTSHGKFSFKWTPAADWLFRGSVGSGFRAPTVAQMQDTVRYQSQLTSALCTPQLLAIARQLGGVCPSDGRYWVQTQGSSNLKPELSNQLNLGLRFSPNRNNTFSLDYWRVDVKDRISALPQDLVLSNPNLYAKFFELDANKQLRNFIPMLNIGQTQKAGVDFAWNYRNPTEWGRLYAGLNGTLLLSSRYQLSDSESFVNEIDKYSYYAGYVVPRLRSQWQLGLTRQEWSIMATLNHVSGYDDGGFVGVNVSTGVSETVSSHRVPAWWTLDFNSTYELNQKVNLKFGIENLLNRKAPVSFGQSISVLYGANLNYSSVWGRTLTLAANYKF